MWHSATQMVTEDQLDGTVLQPSEFDIAVLLLRRPVPGNRWIADSWQVAGAVHAGARGSKPGAAAETTGPRQVLCTGLRLKLYPDEAESYYYNLMAPTPWLYVVTRSEGLGARPEPFHVTASFDEAHAYLEADDDIHQVAVPAEILPWLERFVLDHYRPEPRRKRKRKDWKKEPPS